MDPASTTQFPTPASAPVTSAHYPGAMPALGLGTWKLEGEACRRTVARAVELGYRHVDTAQGYGNETDVAEALRGAGAAADHAWVTTKVWVDGLDHAGVTRVAERSLRALRGVTIDLMLVHWPPVSGHLESALEALWELVERGDMRAVGVSNFTAAQLARAVEVAPIFCNQIEFHPLLGQGVLERALRERGVALAAYSPLAHGAVSEEATLRRLAEAHGVSPALLCLRWALQRGNVAVIPKASSHHHLVENLKVFDFVLDMATMEAVDGCARGLRTIDPEFAPEWDRPSRHYP